MWELGKGEMCRKREREKHYLERNINLKDEYLSLLSSFHSSSLASILFRSLFSLLSSRFWFYHPPLLCFFPVLLSNSFYLQISQSFHQSRPNTKMLDQPAGFLWSSFFEEFLFIKNLCWFFVCGGVFIALLAGFIYLADWWDRKGWQRDLAVRGAGYEHSTASACGGAKWLSLHWRRRCQTRRNAVTWLGIRSP